GFCAASVLYFSLAYAVLTETLCVFFLSWFVCLSVRWLDTFNKWDLLGAAISLAAGVYVRPAAYYFIPLAVMGLIGLTISKKSRSLGKQSLLFFVLPVIWLIGAWQVRNYMQTGYGGFTSVGAYNLYIWNEDYIAHQNGISVTQAHQQLHAQLPENFYALPATEQVRTYKKLAAPLLKQSWKHKLRQGPRWAAKTLLGNNYAHLSQLVFGKEITPSQALNQTASLPRPWLTGWAEKLLFVVTLLPIIGIILLAGWGLWELLKIRRTAALFLTIYCFYFWAIGSSFFGAYTRLRAPFEFVLCILAGLAVCFWKKRGPHQAGHTQKLPETKI
ncbi:MAG: hypothetical protein IKO35_04895, partial [Elusimicrobiaceae bacterium]|nr:hypothetical protein [Elusimicrobiaceae bacterium]